MYQIHKEQSVSVLNKTHADVYLRKVTEKAVWMTDAGVKG